MCIRDRFLNASTYCIIGSCTKSSGPHGKVHRWAPVLRTIQKCSIHFQGVCPTIECDFSSMEMRLHPVCSGPCGGRCAPDGVCQSGVHDGYKRRGAHWGECSSECYAIGRRLRVRSVTALLLAAQRAADAQRAGTDHPCILLGDAAGENSCRPPGAAF